MKEINKIVPWEDGYLHMEGNAAAYLKASQEELQAILLCRICKQILRGPFGEPQ